MIPETFWNLINVPQPWLIDKIYTVSVKISGEPTGELSHGNGIVKGVSWVRF